jgi:ribonuclease Y
MMATEILLALLAAGFAGLSGVLYARLQALERLDREVPLANLAERERALQAREQASREEALALASAEIQAEEEALAREAKERGAKALAVVMERHLARAASSGLAARVALPSEDSKARLIGKEGRNIRAFEQITQTDLIIDETPDAVHVSCFDPLRREAARITLINLLLDGRIHPARIEELHELSQEGLSLTLMEECAQEAEAEGIFDLPDTVLQPLSRLRLRTSLGQNVWDHSLECCRLARLAAQEIGLSRPDRAALAALLHDVGKALGSDQEGPHAIAGMRLLAQEGFDPVVQNAVGAHHLDIEPLYAESHLVILADILSASRPGARTEARERRLHRLEALEQRAESFPGVLRAFALQAGREIRVMVEPAKVPDSALRGFARALREELKREAEAFGDLKVVAIRETRAVESED